MKLLVLAFAILCTVYSAPTSGSKYDPRKEQDKFFRSMTNPNGFRSLFSTMTERVFTSISNFYKTFVGDKKTPRHRTHRASANRPINPLRKLQADDEALNGTSGIYFTYLSKFEDEGKTKYYAFNETTPRNYTADLNDTIPQNRNIDSCVRGKLLDVEYIIYTCFGESVTKTEYEATPDKDTLCSLTTQTGKACYCPSNYHGEQCQYYIPLFCQYEMVHPTTEQVHCTSSSINVVHEHYDNKRFGIPPCIFYKDGEFVVKARLKCKRHPLAVKGYKEFALYIKDSDVEQNVDEPVEAPISVVNVLSVHNFVTLTKYYQVVSEITYDPTSTDVITFPPVNLKELTHLRYGGRWHIQILPGTYTDGIMRNTRVVGEPVQFTVDDENYAEPSKDSSLRWWVIFLIVISVLLGIALIVLIVVCICRRQKAKAAFLKD
eukprot:TRINITY_DN9477_c0_g1_i11.p1 TRINITY_DN9477_c0_g1~~TRINITY_DN9477_c0_g1_i11.p1  ORF type:complete len:433 (-),score=84.89 TRINITY_DN9477_c0_g1_i11:116-1414(-)